MPPRVRQSEGPPARPDLQDHLVILTQSLPSSVLSSVQSQGPVDPCERPMFRSPDPSTHVWDYRDPDGLLLLWLYHWVPWKRHGERHDSRTLVVSKDAAPMIITAGVTRPPFQIRGAPSR